MPGALQEISASISASDLALIADINGLGQAAGRG